RRGVLRLSPGGPPRIPVEEIVADNAELMAMHARRRAEFTDLLRLLRIAHVMHGEAFRPVIARAADRPDIGMALVHLHEAAAAPRRRRIPAEQPAVLRLFAVAG